MNVPRPRPTAGRLFKPTTLAIALALAGAAIAQTAPTAAQQKELDAARANLDQAAQRYAELSRKYGGADAPIRIEKRVLRKPVIGVLLAPDDKAGVRIAGVTPDSAAAAGGLKSGDRIVSIDDKAINAATGPARVDQTRELLASTDAKTPVKLTFERDGKSQAVSLTPKVGDRLMVIPELPEGSLFDGNVQFFSGDDGSVEVLADRLRGNALRAKGNVRVVTQGDEIEMRGDRMNVIVADAKQRSRLRTPATDADRPAEWAMIAPDVRTEVIRLGSDCKGEDCKLPVLAEAFRWNGLNLASVDAGLGRYFGSERGVLVLSTGKDLDGLQAGDVILKIAGKAVNSPREAMDALRAQPAEGKVAVEYLRDRATGTTQISVPKALPFALPRTAMAPRAPGAIEKRKMVFVGDDGKVQTFEGGDGKAPPVWVEALPKGGKKVEKRKIVMIDKDGKRSEWEGDAKDAPPAWAQALTKDGKRIEKRVQVIVDDKGNRTVVEGDDLPLPPPPPKVD